MPTGVLGRSECLIRIVDENWKPDRQSGVLDFQSHFMGSSVQRLGVPVQLYAQSHSPALKRRSSTYEHPLVLPQLMQR